MLATQHSPRANRLTKGQQVLFEWHVQSLIQAGYAKAHLVQDLLESEDHQALANYLQHCQNEQLDALEAELEKDRQATAAAFQQMRLGEQLVQQLCDQYPQRQQAKQALQEYHYFITYFGLGPQANAAFKKFYAKS